MSQHRHTAVVLGFALFAMFFGAGNLIFPPTLGRLFGDQFSLSAMGFLLTGVGLPLLGIIAVAKSEGGIDHIARRVDPRFSKALAILIMLAIGPLFAIPRTCATTFEIGIAPNLPFINSWIFSAIFFGVVLFFALNPLSVVDRIGKILTPILMLSLFVLIARGFMAPITEPIATGELHAFGRSLIEGYQTMDMIGATIMGIIILNEVRSKGIFEKHLQIRTIVKAGLISCASLALIYGGLTYLGASTGGMALSLSRTELLVFIARHLFGHGGGLLLAVVVSMACLTTAIALTVVCAEYFNKLSFGKLNYRAICILTAAISFLFSNAGVESIVSIALPVLMTLYPVVMVLVILCLAGDRVANRNIWRGATIGAFLIGIIDTLAASGASMPLLFPVRNALPLTELGLGWLLPAAALGGLGALIRPRTVHRTFRILAVCPSQLKTRVAIFDDTMTLFDTAIPHQLDQARDASERTSQLIKIKEELKARLEEHHLDLSTIDAVAARGGFLHPLPSGVYRVKDAMIRDLEEHAWRQHPSNWAASIAYEIALAHDIDAFIVDPIVVDEMVDVARMTGLPKIQRSSIFHASNQKAVARRVAKNLWKPVDRINAIIAHVGDGTSVGAHEQGKVIDVNNALDGDGPFSALNAGSLPTVDVVNLCFAPGASEEGVLHQIRSAGGLLAYLGTADTDEINARIASHDQRTLAVIEAMAYQVSKEIAALSASLRGRVDAIAITGELATCAHLVRSIRQRIAFLAPVFVYPGESETEALVHGALRILRGEEELLEYQPI